MFEDNGKGKGRSKGRSKVRDTPIYTVEGRQKSNTHKDVKNNQESWNEYTRSIWEDLTWKTKGGPEIDRTSYEHPEYQG